MPVDAEVTAAAAVADDEDDIWYDVTLFIIYWPA